jgi:hypothetical protein
MSNLTSEQLEAITYAYMDICATDKILNDNSWDHRLAYNREVVAIAEVGEAVKLTREDLEKAFPFLIEDVEDE